MLNSDEILERIHKQRLIDGYVDLKQQLQPSSFDLTLGKVFHFTSQGAIDFDNSGRKISDVEQLGFVDDWLVLKQGAYKIQYNEIIRVPPDLVGLTLCRSSLTRCGCDLYNGLWDPGYEGRGETVFLVHNPEGINLKKDAKIAQIVFLKINELKEIEKVYSGIHRGENL